MLFAGITTTFAGIVITLIHVIISSNPDYNAKLRQY